VTNTETDAAPNRVNSMSFSTQIRLRRWARRALVRPSGFTVVETAPVGATADIVLFPPEFI
jgi:hypothetical protein